MSDQKGGMTNLHFCVTECLLGSCKLGSCESLKGGGCKRRTKTQDKARQGKVKESQLSKDEMETRGAQAHAQAQAHGGRAGLPYFDPIRCLV
jgi:hypothetical protein